MGNAFTGPRGAFPKLFLVRPDGTRPASPLRVAPGPSRSGLTIFALPRSCWPIVAERRQNKGDIRMPFHALATDGVWSVFDAEGRPSRSRETSVRARLDDNLLGALGNSTFRAQPRRLLVATYFPSHEQVALFAALGFEGAADSSEISTLAEDQATYRIARDTGRNARFKNEVVTNYRFTCALTGYRLTTTDQSGIVDAAHIHQHARSRNNDPENGIALTPTAHRLFDLGLWSVTDDLRVIVKPTSTFSEESPEGGFTLRALHGQPLRLTTQTRLRPAARHLAWHRKEHGFNDSALST